ncbi:MAG: phosphate ABC transporter permease PstA [Halanaeroarchaeum sp.]
MGGIEDGSVSFERVSRTTGIIFKYLLLAATLFGIVMLGVLLVYVAWDAVQPLTADAGWHLTYLLTLVLPTVGASAYLYRRNDGSLTFGWMTVGMLVVTLLFSGGAAMIFVDIVTPIVWFAFVVAVGVPSGLVVLMQRYEGRISVLWRAAVTVAVFYESLFGIPGPLGRLLGVGEIVPSLIDVVLAIPVLPLDWMLMLVTLGLGISAMIGGYAATISDGRTGLLTGGVALGTIAVIANVGPLLGVDPMPSTVVASIAIVPTATYLGAGIVTRDQQRIGAVIPLVVVGGSLLGWVLVHQFGFAGPEAWVDWQFLTSAHSTTAEEAGLYPAIGGSILLMLTVATFSFPLGVGAAVYLEEYAPDNRVTRFIDVNISNLAGVPSVVYGLLGLSLFVTHLNQPAGTVLVGGATLALLILPIVIISSREAIRSVPEEVRQAAYGMGATRWQTVKTVVLPHAFPGILTGTILALGRAIGETAPLIMILAPNVVFSLPTTFTSKVSAMPLQVYAWASLYASEEFYTKAVPAGVVVLVTVMLAMNAVAIVLRNKYQSEQ